MGIVTVKIFKSFGGRGARRDQWSNGYHLNTEHEVGAPELDALVNAIVAFEKSFHHPSVHFMSYVISTYEKEGRGVVGTNTRSVELSGQGERNWGTASESLDHAVHVKYSATTGRTGSCYYRGAVPDSKVEAGGNGAPQMSAEGQAELGATLGYFKGQPVFDSLVLPNSKSDDGLPFRQITDVSVASVASRKRNVNRRRSKKVTDDSAPALVTAVGETLGDVVTHWLKNRSKMATPQKAALNLAATAVGALVNQLLDPGDTD